MQEYVWVFLGGGLGSLARYSIGLRLPELAGTLLPWGTLSVNVLGSFAIGVLEALAVEHGLFSAEQRIFLMTGILGGFTTFSAFSLETRGLFRNDDPGLGVLYVALTVGSCLVAVWGGWAAGKAAG